MPDHFNMHIDVDPLAAKYFIVFSRFEFALKRGGFAIGKVGFAAKPNWGGFGKKLGNPFFELVKAHAAAKVFFDNPPKRLDLLEGGLIRFRHVEDVTNTKTLFDAVNRVRNNLFHGEKLFLGMRDRVLVEASLVVLAMALETASQIEDCKQVSELFIHAQPLQ